MSHIAYVNGRYVPLRKAQVHVEDRGFQFADGVYEVFPVYAGRIVNQDWHMQRLAQSLQGLRMVWPLAPGVLNMILPEMLRRNGVTDGGMIYLQITRGVSPRNHAFPGGKVKPTLVIMARAVNMAARHAQAETGVRVITVPENRWPRRDIKSVSLLPNMLAKQQAAEQGASEALYVNDRGIVTEGASSTFWIVRPDGVLMTHPLGHDILPGVTRRVVLEIAREKGLKVEEREFTLAEAVKAREAFLTSATNFVMPVTQIDGQILGNGAPGDLSLSLRRAYIERIE
ncbi:MAG TPA: D-amino-acid transaminase [Alphaproteobacteria bacterium]|nr:D-amino-acid transaminase [Alphaproteobacteria bacterium]